MSDPVVSIAYESCREELIALRRHFHAHPELSLEERDTADYVEAYLRGLGLETQRVGDCGVTAVVWAPAERQPCKTVAVRAEMDAIPVREETDVPWRSRRDGVMHACGHDAILATGLVLAKLCAERRELLPVNVKLLFQPAEENGRGTRIMLDGGAMEEPHVDYFVMFHYTNDAPAGVELQREPATAAIGSVQIKVKGQTSHWCTYRQGVDAIAAAGEVLRAVGTINRTYRTDAPFILGIGTISGGTAKNIVAGETELVGTLRACKLEDYHALRRLLLEELARVGRETGAEIEAAVDQVPIPPIVNDGTLVDLGLEAGGEVCGENCRLTPGGYLAGDSAAYFFDAAKGIFFVFTAERAGERNYPLHNGKFDLDESVLWRAVAVLHRFIQKL